MSSSTTISFSVENVRTLMREIKAVSSKEKALLKPILESILTAFINKPADIPSLLRQILSQNKEAKKVLKIKATDMSSFKVAEVFGLKFDFRNEWVLAQDNLVKVPSTLVRNLRDLKEAGYDERSEATCRLAVDFVLIQCRKYLRQKHQLTESNSEKANIATTIVASPSTPRKAVDAGLMKRFIVYPESSVSVEIPNESVSGGKYQVTGRADWVMGYGDTEDGAVLIAVEAKQREEFGKGEGQLLAYLAILQENRRRACKKNIITQGFYTDGDRYQFVCIREDGVVRRSTILETSFANQLTMVFNFIIAMMETAMKSTPNATPTKPGLLRDKEIDNYEDEVWTKIYAMVEQAFDFSDSDSDEAMDVPYS